jgi:homoserine O-acetyltransferase/O-succinyltransferase
MSASVQTELRAVTRYQRFDSIALDTGAVLMPVEVAYQTYGELNADQSNAILICHAFTGDAHAAGISAEDGQKGWWDNMIGPGKAFDTNQYFVICSNVLGGCRGTTGPASVNPDTAQPYGMNFPMITIGDMVRLQKMLVESLGISKLLAVAGGSMGGMQVLEWAVAYPESVASCLAIATTARHGAQQIAFNEVGRQAIMADPDFHNGSYSLHNTKPARGLSVARMVGHITYMSDDSMRTKFGRRLREKDTFSFDFSAEFEVESYLRYRGSRFVDRFDATSYLYITKAMDYYDLAANDATLPAALEKAQARFLVISFTSDWLYPSYQSLEIVSALRSRNKDVAYVELDSNHGHDAFLVEVQEQSVLVSGFLETTMRMQRKEPRAHATVQDFAGRQDFSVITNWIAPRSSVLDLGCGDGALIAWLGEYKECDARGVEIDRELVQRAIARGASAYQADIERSLTDYPDHAFDYVILSQTLQQSRKPLDLLRNILRAGKHAIVGFPNFSHWSVRWSHLVSGRAPQNELFPYEWYESPNIHFVTVKDFEMLCAREGWTVEKKVFFSAQGQVTTLPNLTAEIAVYLLRR